MRGVLEVRASALCPLPGELDENDRTLAIQTQLEEILITRTTPAFEDLRLGFAINPRWNRSCRNCSGARTGRIRATPRTQSSIAISADDEG